MCGIMAVKGKDCVGDVITGLKALEYRGYDSAGIACKVENKIEIKKALGYVQNLEDISNEIRSDIAIGHTRWATHGGVNISNSHPHSSSCGRFSIVHNGIIENHRELKNEYLANVQFTSETDTEVAVQLMSKFYNGNVFETFKKVISMLEGSYAIVMINSIDDNIYFARKSSPMVVSKTESKIMLSSDVNGFKDKSNIYYVDDDNIGYIDNNIHVFDKNYTNINVQYVDLTYLGESVDLSGFGHYMHKEIYEIPSSLQSSFAMLQQCRFRLPKKIDRILMVACGTSYHSTLIGKKYIEQFAGIKCECEIASEFIYNNYLSTPNTLAIFISQSGETADTLTALKKCKSMGMYTLAITNVAGSTITRIADSCVLMNCGAEICVASTKAYTSQVFLLLMLSNILINHSKGNYIESDDCMTFEWRNTSNYLDYTDGDLDELFALDVSAFEESAKQVAETINKTNTMHLIGKDYDYISAMEGSLKIKEVSYIFTDAYACGELKHGTLSLIDNESIVLAIMTDEKLVDKCNNAMHEITARGGKCILVSPFDTHDVSVRLPRLNKLFMPIVSIVPIDLIAYRVARLRGYNPDRPRNLAKSVTVE